LWALGALIFVSPTPAPAQLAAAVSVENDYRLRGRSVSGRRPVASAQVGFDAPRGIYGDGSAAVVATRYDGLQVLGYQLDAGYAARVGNLWTIDVGVARDHFRASYPGGPAYRHFEAYAGATRGPFSAYLFASPDYDRTKSATLYGQLEATIAPASAWRVTAHAGMLALLDPHAEYSALYDWRLGISRAIGNFELHAAISDGGVAKGRHDADDRARTALTAGASYSF
jgi:uncharacterized protein (TIGR02001 family)